MQVFIVPDGLIISSKFARQYNGLILILVNEIPHYGDRERIFFPRIPLFSKGSELEVSGRQKYVSTQMVEKRKTEARFLTLEVDGTKTTK